MAYFGQLVFGGSGTFHANVPSLRSPNTSPEDLWTLDQPKSLPRPITRSYKATTESASSTRSSLYGKITPEIFAASREIRTLTVTLGAPQHVLFGNFLKYTDRVGVQATTDNFIFYLRNWADLDLRIGVSNFDDAAHKEIFLKKVQKTNSALAIKEMENTTSAPMKLLKRPCPPVKPNVRAMVQNGTTYYNIELPAATKADLAQTDLLQLEKRRLVSMNEDKKPMKKTSNLSPEKVLKMKEEAKREFAKMLAEYSK